MQVHTGTSANGTHVLPVHGGYEWWYVDAVSADGAWGFTAILFRGMPMSPEYLAAQSGTAPALPDAHPDANMGWSLSVYHNRQRVYFDFASPQAPHSSYATERCDVRIGAQTLVEMPDGEYRLRFDTRLPGAERGAVLEADLRPMATMPVTGTVAPGSPLPDIHADAHADAHAWIVAAPWCSATIRIQLYERTERRADVPFHAYAYHDHNVGARPLQADFRTWLWGRIHGDDGATVYLAAPDAAQPFVWMGRLTPGGLLVLNDVQCAPSHQRYTAMGLHVPREVHLSGTGNDGSLHTIRCRNVNVVENGPFYQRYLSEWNVNGQPAGIGMSEAMNVRRLAQPWIRPFLRLPFHRP